MFSKKGVCFEFIEKLPDDFLSEDEKSVQRSYAILNTVFNSTTNIVLFHGEFQSILNLRFLLNLLEFSNVDYGTKVWVMTADVDFSSVLFQRSWDINFIHGTLSLSVQSMEISGFQNFIQMRNPTLDKEDSFLKDFWQQTFNCLLPTSSVKEEDETICTGEEKIENLPTTVFETSMTAHSYSVYTAVYAIAHALHVLYSFQGQQRSVRRQKILNQESWKVSRLLRTSQQIQYIDSIAKLSISLVSSLSLSHIFSAFVKFQCAYFARDSHNVFDEHQQCVLSFLHIFFYFPFYFRVILTSSYTVLKCDCIA